jgi:hypothetical protein
MNSAAILIAASSTLAMFGLAFVAVLGFKLIVAWMRHLELRDSEKAMAEGEAAAARGEPGTANPYINESADRFKAMAEAWARGWVGNGRQV